MDIIQTIIQYLPIAIQYFLAFALLITVVVFIHELGHYSVGRWCGIGVETFVDHDALETVMAKPAKEEKDANRYDIMHG